MDIKIKKVENGFIVERWMDKVPNKKYVGRTWEEILEGLTTIFHEEYTEKAKDSSEEESA